MIADRPEHTPSVRPTDRVADQPTANAVRTGKTGKARNESSPAGTPTRRRNSGVGRAQLAALRAELSGRDIAILRSLALHRYLSTVQLERWHFVGHATPLSAARRSRAVLARLRGVGLVETLDRRIGGIRQGSSSYLWYLTAAGHRLLNPEQHHTRPYEPSTRFLQHRLGVAETHLRLIEADRKKIIELSDVSTEPDCWREYLSPLGGRQTIKPDLFAVVSTPAADYESLWFIEWDEGTESLPVIERKAAAYEDYRKSGTEQQRSGVFPRVLWIAPAKTRRDRILQALGRTATITHQLHRVIVPADLLSAIVQD